MRFDKFKKTYNWILNTILVSLTFFIIAVLCVGSFIGVLSMLIDKSSGNINDSFMQFLITLCFVFAGFTFFSLENDIKKPNNKNNEFMFNLINLCWSFILAGFLLFTFYAIMNIPTTKDSNQYVTFLKQYISIAGICGVAIFLFSLGNLVYNLKFLIDKIHEKRDSENKVK